VKKLLIFAAAIVGFPAMVFAWGTDGHQITCMIAEERLTPVAKAEIAELLGEGHISDEGVASWADNIRRNYDFTGPWHYVDIPPDATGFDEKRDGNGGENVIEKIEVYEMALADRMTPRAWRIEALKFVCHFAGDLHQPLHCADRNGDRGGNSRLVFFLDQPRATNLHSVWDSAILRQHMGSVDDRAYAKKLNDSIALEQVVEWERGSALDWANESHEIAAKVAYAGVPADGPPPKLSQAYLENAANVIDVQLEKGGVRLATILNRCLVGPVATTRPTTMATSAPAK
jgi:S1/P1 Nuclease